MLSTTKICGAAAGLASLAMVATASPSLAASDTAQRIIAGNTPITYVQWRGRHGGHHGFHGGFRGHWGGGPRLGYHRRYYGHRDWGYGPGLGVGLATGAILGGVLAAEAAQAAPPPVPDANYLAYCESKYRSFDPASGTYLGYDGNRHACVYP